MLGLHWTAALRRSNGARGQHVRLSTCQSYGSGNDQGRCFADKYSWIRHHRCEHLVWLHGLFGAKESMLFSITQSHPRQGIHTMNVPNPVVSNSNQDHTKHHRKTKPSSQGRGTFGAPQTRPDPPRVVSPLEENLLHSSGETVQVPELQTKTKRLKLVHISLLDASTKFQVYKALRNRPASESRRTSFRDLLWCTQDMAAGRS